MSPLLCNTELHNLSSDIQLVIYQETDSTSLRGIFLHTLYLLRTYRTPPVSLQSTLLNSMYTCTYNYSYQFTVTDTLVVFREESDFLLI